MRFSSRADRISNLPKNVTEAILAHLPIKDAVRTSALSKSWRHEWCTLPRIIIDRASFPFFTNRVVKIVDHILLLHCGPIQCFKLSVYISSCADIDRWVLFLSRNGIKRLALDKLRGEFEDLHIETTPDLATASFNLVSATHDSLEDRAIDRVLGSLPSIERLELLDDTLRNLSTGDVPVSLPLLWPLIHLRICMNFEDMQEILAAFCIFRSSIDMQKLDIKATTDGRMPESLLMLFGKKKKISTAHLVTFKL